jgi:tight adherence protein B
MIAPTLGQPLVAALFAAATALGTWSITRMAFDAAGGDRRRLKKRLSVQAQAAPGTTAAQKSIRTDAPSIGFEARLRQFKVCREIDALVQLSYPDVGLTKFVGIVGAIVFTVFMIVLALTLNPIFSVVCAALGGVSPLLYLSKRKIKRQKMLDDQLPDAMDFLGRALKAGHSLASGLQMMGSELPEPINGEFQHAYDQHSLGIPMDRAMKDMTRRIDSTDFAFFITAVLIQRQTGGDLSEVLKNISGMIRQRVRLNQQVKAKTAEGRFTGYVLTAFPAVIFVILYVINREYAQRLTNTSTGRGLLCLAFGMQMMGLWLIRQLTTVKA